MAARNGKTGVPTGNRSDHHTFPCTKPTRIVLYSSKPAYSLGSIVPVYEK